MSPADRAWLAVAAGVTAWDLACPHDQTLSAAASRYHQHRPWTTRAIIVYLAGHLMGWWPPRADPLHLLTRLKRPRP